MAKNTRRLLMVVAKAPARGQTKTRLGALIGLDAAADFYRCLLDDVVSIARAASALLPGIQCAIAYWPEGSEAVMRSIAPEFELVLQRGDALGDRLNHVLNTALSSGYQQAAVLSSDTPFVDPAALVDGFLNLDSGADIALGPCTDGGYYVMHTRAPQPDLLIPIQMSTATVFDDTLAAARRLNLNVATLPETTDVDTPDDIYSVLKRMGELPPHVATRTRAWLTHWQQTQIHAHK
jgi:uncharacterized protein